jgi:hypothetical protein
MSAFVKSRYPLTKTITLIRNVVERENIGGGSSSFTITFAMDAAGLGNSLGGKGRRFRPRWNIKSGKCLFGFTRKRLIDWEMLHYRHHRNPLYKLTQNCEGTERFN